MPFATDKPLKTCKFCNKNVANLATHIINNHPSVMDQIEETAPAIPAQPHSAQNAGVIAQNKPVGLDTKALIRDKLDTLFDAMLLKAMTENPNMSIKDLSQIINPPQQTTLQDLKVLHDMIYSEKEVSGGAADGWIGLATAALPIIGQLLPAKKQQMEGVKDEHRANQDGSIQVSGSIQQEVGEHREKPIDLSQEPSGISSEPEQISGSGGSINQRS